MIYKVVFKKEGATGIHITETKFKDISRVCTGEGNGVTFFNSEGEVLTFIPNESLLYIEKVEPLTASQAFSGVEIPVMEVNRSWFERLLKDVEKNMEKEVFVYGKFPRNQEGG